MKLSRNVLGIDCKNPLVLAACPEGRSAKTMLAIAAGGAGLVTTKSMSAAERRGNPEPVFASFPAYSLNAVGLTWPGAQATMDLFEEYMRQKPVPLIANIVGLTVQDFVDIAQVVAPLKPDAIEINLSSPTFLKLRGSFLTENEDEFTAIIKAVKKEAGDIPVFVKLSPNVPNIGEIAKQSVAAGIDGLTAINTVGPGMVIDAKTRLPVLSAHKGGVSGPGIKAVALRCVADMYAATGGKTPIIGVGGITTGEDAIEMLLAGASLVGIATAIYERGNDVFMKVAQEMEEWCQANGVQDIAELTGGMHKELASQGSPYKI